MEDLEPRVPKARERSFFRCTRAHPSPQQEDAERKFMYDSQSRLRFPFFLRCCYNQCYYFVASILSVLICLLCFPLKVQGAAVFISLTLMLLEHSGETELAGSCDSSADACTAAREHGWCHERKKNKTSKFLLPVSD